MRYLILVILLAGCAFKPEDPATETGAAINGQGGTRLAELSWDEGSGPMNRAVVGSKNFSIPDPISIPPEIPDKIRIAFSAPLVSGKLLQEPRAFITESTDGNQAGPPVRLKGLLEPSGISVAGLKTFFAVNKQQKGVLRVSLMNAVTGDEEASLGLTLVSTPASASVSYVEKGDVRDVDLKKFTAPEMRLDLLLVLKLKNNNVARTEFQLPGELKGSLRKFFKRHDFAERHCKTDFGTVEWTDTYTARYFLLPLDEGVARDWISYLSDAERVETLDPGEERLLGVYGSGPQVASFSDNGAPFHRPSTAQVVKSCNRVCDGFVSVLRDPIDRPRHACSFEPNYGPIPFGLESTGAYWALDEASTRLKARNAFLSRQDDPATREISFLESQRYVF